MINFKNIIEISFPDDGKCYMCDCACNTVFSFFFYFHFYF